MYKNYIILAHKNPQQIKHLIEKLNDDNSRFFIHVDLNSDSKPFKSILSTNHNVALLKKERMELGAILELYRLP